jgi:hypothetical protein
MRGAAQGVAVATEQIALGNADLSTRTERQAAVRDAIARSTLASFFDTLTGAVPSPPSTTGSGDSTNCHSGPSFPRPTRCFVALRHVVVHAREFGHAGEFALREVRLDRMQRFLEESDPGNVSVAAAMPASAPMSASTAMSTTDCMSAVPSAVPTVAVPVTAAPTAACTPNTAGPILRPVDGAVHLIVWLGVPISCYGATTQARRRGEQRNQLKHDFPSNDAQREPGKKGRSPSLITAKARKCLALMRTLPNAPADGPLGAALNSPANSYV